MSQRLRTGNDATTALTYRSYVGTDVLEALIDRPGATADDVDARAREVAAAILADLLLFEETVELDGARMPPPADVLDKRRRAAATALARFTDVDIDSRDRLARTAPEVLVGVQSSVTPATAAHDEVMFIRVLQLFECVFLAMQRRLKNARDALLAGDTASATASVRRAGEMLARGMPVFRVLATISREAFAVIRERTVGASGLQSVTFKHIELLCAAPGKDRLGSPAFTPKEVAALVDADEPSIDAVIAASREARADDALLHAVSDLDIAWRRWKRTHWAIALHVIGEGPGSGGTSGTSYLRKYMHAALFPALSKEVSRRRAQLPLLTDMPPGPAEVELARLIARLPIAQGRGMPVVTQCRRSIVGDFKLDARSVLVPSLAADRDACADLARTIQELPEIEKAVGVPPSVYVTPTIDWLRETVVDGILANGTHYGTADEYRKTVLHVQFSCPNLNKGLHLGHFRNNVVGEALARIAEACGYRVVRVDQPSSWGKHIAKAVLAYVKWGGDETPSSTDTKPDVFVERFYAEYARCASDSPELEDELDDFVRRVEAGDPTATAAVERVTRWAYEGIRRTYERIGTRFDVLSPEGETLGIAIDHIASHVGDAAEQRPDGSIFVDLSHRGMRELTLVRADGTPLLPVQFLGACIRRQQLDPDATIMFLMGQEYKDAMPELLGTLEVLGLGALASRIEPVYHGMVTDGGGDKMSSRSGGAVSADEFLDEIRARLVAERSAELGRPLDWYETDVCERLAIALAKYHFLRVRRTKGVTWDATTLWHRTAPAFDKLLRLGDGGTPSPKGDRALLLHLNRFARSQSVALESRDPADVVRFLDDLCDLTTRTQSDSGTREASALVVRRGLAFLGIDISPFATGQTTSTARS